MVDMHTNGYIFLLVISLTGCKTFIDSGPGVITDPCQKITTPLAVADLPADLNTTAFASMAGSRDATVTWADGETEALHITSAVGDDWRVISLTDKEAGSQAGCEDLPARYVATVTVSATSTSGLLDGHWTFDGDAWLTSRFDGDAQPWEQTFDYGDAASDAIRAAHPAASGDVVHVDVSWAADGAGVTGQGYADPLPKVDRDPTADTDTSTSVQLWTIGPVK